MRDDEVIAEEKLTGHARRRGTICMPHQRNTYLALFSGEFFYLIEVDATDKQEAYSPF